MSFVESADAVESAFPQPSLLARRPAHGAMTSVLRGAQHGKHSATSDFAARHSAVVGELIVGHELAQLSPEWQVLHSVPAAAHTDIDHLVIGPGGVFVIETAHHVGEDICVGSRVVWVDGTAQARSHRGVQHRVAQVRTLVAGIGGASETVQPLLVFVSPATFSRAGVQTVPSAQVGELVDLLEEAPTVLMHADIQNLVTLLSRPESWGRAATVAEELDPTAEYLAQVRQPTAIERFEAPRVIRAAGTRRGADAIPALEPEAEPAMHREPPSRAPAHRMSLGVRLSYGVVALLSVLVVLPLFVAVIVDAISAALTSAH